MRERDVGLFSLVQQVIANVPWALRRGLVPVADFGERCCYWVPLGYEGATRSVWEYYFEPVVSEWPAASISDELKAKIDRAFPDQNEVGYFVEEGVFVTNHYGDHPSLTGQALSIPYMSGDPGGELRRRASEVIAQYVRPRPYLENKVQKFFDQHMRGHDVVGVHARGTDAVSPEEARPYRRGSLDLDRFVMELSHLVADRPKAKILVATDEQATLGHLVAAFDDRVISYETTRHVGGNPAGSGPTGAIMPAYISQDPAVAARNGEDAIVEYLLLTHCSHLVHNGAGLGVTVLLHNSRMPHTNTHSNAFGP